MTGFWLGVAFRCVPPRLGAQVDPDGFKVVWVPVTRPAGVEIVTYQVIVNQGDRELSMYLPPSATSATIPGEFLEPGTKTGASSWRARRAATRRSRRSPRSRRNSGDSLGHSQAGRRSECVEISIKAGVTAETVVASARDEHRVRRPGLL